MTNNNKLKDVRVLNNNSTTLYLLEDVKAALGVCNDATYGSLLAIVDIYPFKKNDIFPSEAAAETEEVQFIDERGLASFLMYVDKPELFKLQPNVQLNAYQRMTKLANLCNIN